MSIELVMPSNHLILSFRKLPSAFPSIRVFSNELAVCIMWAKYWSFTISPSNDIQGWFPIRLTGLISLLSKGLSRVFSSTTVWRINLLVHCLLCDGSKVICYKQQYCIGTWSVRSINQGKLEVVKQEMARVNVNILGISELKWTGMGEFNSDDHYIYYCGQESLRKNGVAITVNKRVQNSVLGCNLTKTEWSLFVSKASHSISW